MDREGYPLIGVLDLQGGVDEHIEHFRCSGINAVRVKHAEQISSLAGLVVPGGESSCLSRLLRIFELDHPIVSAHRRGMKLWGTCAGAILLATESVGEKAHLGLIDISVERNAFGSQLDSFTGMVDLPALDAEEVPLTFIRAPKIVRVGQGVRVLLDMGEFVAAAESDDVLVTVFHPELTDSLLFHRYFAQKCEVAVMSDTDHIQGWSRKSWMDSVRQ